MTLWLVLVLALMTLVAVVAVLWPLLRSRGKVRSGSDVAVYRDQIEEIQRDRAVGLIGENEAEAAQVEVSRRLISAADAEANTGQSAAPAASNRHRRAVAVAAAVMLPVGASALYLLLGSPLLPEQLVEQRQATASIQTMVAQVDEHLAKNPNDGRGWELIAPVYLKLGRYQDAIKALRNAIALNGESAERYASLGEALAAAEGGMITAEAKEAFAHAVRLDGENVRARYYLGVAAEQEGLPADAVAIWRAMLARAPADAPWTGFIRAEIARVGAGPGAEDVAAAADLNAEQRTGMIRSMVEQLSERLHRDGSDLEGWLRLVRSYMVLGETEKARAAAGDARRALASDPAKLHRIEEFVKGLGLEG
jgi:cytochrome c-type biogenesis protein CcmH